MITATRYHDFSYGHRVAGHENKCAHLHGHNGRIHFTVRAPENVPALDSIGRVLDFSVINTCLCNWVEANWDHRFLMWNEDPWKPSLADDNQHLVESELGIVRVPFNPTAENMARYLLTEIGPRVLRHTGVFLYRVVMEETRKCSATVEI
jgi:6-pyruvoyltetrahydropterin/6-carboxytetrahydropterin synthase